MSKIFLRIPKYKKKIWILKNYVFFQKNKKSPVHPISESWGVPWAWQRTDGRTDEGGGRRKILCLEFWMNKDKTKHLFWLRLSKRAPAKVVTLAVPWQTQTARTSQPAKCQPADNLMVPTGKRADSLTVRLLLLLSRASLVTSVMKTGWDISDHLQTKTFYRGTKLNFYLIFSWHFLLLKFTLRPVVVLTYREKKISLL